MNIGNIDLERGPDTVTLRMRHVVSGHPGAVLSTSEAISLAKWLQSVPVKREQNENDMTVSDVSEYEDLIG